MSDDLAELEERAERGLFSDYEDAGHALREIRDDRRYRELGFDSWQHYCNQRLGIARQTASDVIRAADVAARRRHPRADGRV